MKVLYIGGTGEISLACVEEAIRAGHDVAVFNRGLRAEPLPSGVEQIVGDLSDTAAYGLLAARDFDVVCQFLAYDPAAVKRDIALFSGHCGQYIFISTASAYQKPCQSHIITEETPLDNPFWEYSRQKAACESVALEAHANGKLPVTIVRPSHTYRTRLPGAVIDGNHLAWRLLHDKPVIVQGDGESLWALTHSDDFARAFVKLCGNSDALGECFHITDSESHTWNAILRAISKIVGRDPGVCPVLSNTLIHYDPAWEGPLLGDKSNSVLFDNTKIKQLTGGWACEISMEEGLGRAWSFVSKRLKDGYQPDKDRDALIDRIIEDQRLRAEA